MIHFVGGEKGGVGKSLTSRLLSQYFLDRARPYAGLDADQSHPTLTRYYGDFTQPVDLDYFESIDRIIEMAVEDDRQILVDLPAQSQRFLDRWIEDTDVLTMCAEMGLGLLYWYVVDDGRDSVALLQRFLERYQGRLQCIVVKNRGRGKDFSELEALPVLRQDDEAVAPIQIELRELHAATMRKIDRLNYSFWAAENLRDAQIPHLTLMERQRTKVWVRHAHAAFDQVIGRVTAEV